MRGTIKFFDERGGFISERAEIFSAMRATCWVTQMIWQTESKSSLRRLRIPGVRE
jgi:hypothetical protein